MAGAEEALEFKVLRPHQRAQRGLHSFEHGPEGEILHPASRAVRTAAAVPGAVVSKPTPRNTTSFPGSPPRCIASTGEYHLHPRTHGAAALQTVTRNAAGMRSMSP